MRPRELAAGVVHRVIGAVHATERREPVREPELIRDPTRREPAQRRLGDGVATGRDAGVEQQAQRLLVPRVPRYGAARRRIRLGELVLREVYDAEPSK